MCCFLTERLKQCCPLMTDCVCVELYSMLCSDLTCGAVCVYPNQVSDSIASLKAAGASHIPVASGTVLSYPFKPFATTSG